jgi:hypothetical protein
MTTCGHCDRKVSGIKDHICNAHGYRFFKEWSDFKYYGYEFLREKNMLQPNEKVAKWDSILDRGNTRSIKRNANR